MPFVSVFTGLPALEVPFASVASVFRSCVGGGVRRGVFLRYSEKVTEVREPLLGSFVLSRHHPQEHEVFALHSGHHGRGLRNLQVVVLYIKCNYYILLGRSGLLPSQPLSWDEAHDVCTRRGTEQSFFRVV